MPAADQRIAKISRPVPFGVLSRERVFRLLDKSAGKRVIWVTGPAGAGKTTLVASWLDRRNHPCIWYQVDEGDADIASFFYYMGLAAKRAVPRARVSLPLLTPEYLMGVPAFTRRYFEELSQRFKQGCVIVFDNFQDAAEASGFHEMIACGLDALPACIQAVVISRSDPPAPLSRLRAGRGIDFIGWKDLRFTEGECMDFLKIQGTEQLPGSDFRKLFDMTDGWAAGLILMAEMAKVDGAGTVEPGALSRNSVFNYFATEIFSETDSETRDFLLKTSFLPAMTASAASVVTGNPRAKLILSGLSRSHFFTDWRALPSPVYQYHPLFREFLQEQARNTFGSGEVRALLMSSASVLEASGGVEEALKLYIDAGAWDRVASLAIGQAPSLVVQGRGRTVDDWLSAIPAPASGSEPWILFWRGLCRMPFDIVQAQDILGRAFRLFLEKDDAAGALMTWAWIVEAIILEWKDVRLLDPWIDWLDEWGGQGNELVSEEIEARVAAAMVWSLVWRRPEHPGIGRWVDRGLELSGRVRDDALLMKISVYAFWHYGWTGDIARISALTGEIARSASRQDLPPLMRITWKCAVAVICNFHDFAPDLSLQHVEEGLRIADEYGVFLGHHVLYGAAACACLQKEDARTAEQYIAALQKALYASRTTMHHYHNLLAWKHLVDDELDRAAEAADTAVHLARESGLVYPHMLCCFERAHIATDRGELDRAAADLSIVSGLARSSGSRLMLFMSLLGEARLALARGDETRCLGVLAEALSVGSGSGYTNIPWWSLRRLMSDLCVVALRHGIQTEYVKRLIRLHAISPPCASSRRADPVIGCPDAWPYPIKIYTLGDFRVLRDDRPPESAGKARQKPFALLKALVSCGPSGASDERLIDLLWPEADADLGHKSYEVTLLRLRRLLGRDGILQHKGRQVSLDSGQCWVDAFAAEELFAAAERVEKAGTVRSGSHEAMRLAERGLDLYRGHFLQEDVDRPWSSLRREKLRSAAMRAARLLGRIHKANEAYEEAAEWCRRGLEIDDLSEELYQEQMDCLLRLGRKAEAVRAYQDCCRALSSKIGITPSERTEEIYFRITGKG